MKPHWPISLVWFIFSLFYVWDWTARKVPTHFNLNTWNWFTNISRHHLSSPYSLSVLPTGLQNMSDHSLPHVNPTEHAGRPVLGSRPSDSPQQWRAVKRRMRRYLTAVCSAGPCLRRPPVTFIPAFGELTTRWANGTVAVDNKQQGQ